MQITPITPPQRNVWQPRRPTNEEIAARMNQQIKSQAQLDYEADVEQTPYYHDGGKRKTWDELDDIAKWSWREQYER